MRKVLKKYCKCTSNKDQNRKQFLVDVRNIYAEEFLVKGDAYNLWDNHLRVVDVDPDSGIESTIKGQKVCAVSGDYSNNLPS